MPKIPPKMYLKTSWGKSAMRLIRDIKTDIRRETNEVVAEEQLSPSDSLSGIYVSFDEDPTTCSLSITSSSVAGRCAGENDVATVSGTSRDFY